MPPNSSTISNDPLPSGGNSSGVNFGAIGYCFSFEPGRSIFAVYTVTILLLLLPLCILVLYLSLHRWWTQRSSHKVAKMTTHSDSFAFHMVIMEIIHVFGTLVHCPIIYQKDIQMKTWSLFFAVAWFGETFFHNLTCLEIYLAVVRPILYLKLRKVYWVRVRHVLICCIWLVCVLWTSVEKYGTAHLIAETCLLMSSLVVISFCSLSVLWVLIQPSPGKQSNDRMKVDQSKQRPFYSILVILGVLVFRVSWTLVWGMIEMQNIVNNTCVEIMCEIWINLPASVLLPLLFLLRNGTFTCFKSNR